MVRKVDATHPALSGMARFNEKIYDQPDPRAYFQTLGPLEYQIPHHAQPVFRRLLDGREALGSQSNGSMVDLCSSYGINTALLNHDLTLQDLYVRYSSPQLAELSTSELMAADRTFFQQRLRSDAVSSVGIDPAANAISYAVGAGVLDAAFPENLEIAPPSPALRSAVAQATLITVTGGVTFLSARTFQRLLGCMSTPAWVAAFVVRKVPYQTIAATLEGFGLVTEKLSTRTFPQRRFSNAEEQRRTLKALSRMGINPEGKEGAGYYHAELYLSRSARDIAALPLETLLTFTTHA
jgi:hypothetical protein